MMYLLIVNSFSQKPDFESLLIFFLILQLRENGIIFFLFCISPVTFSIVILHSMFGWEWNFDFLISRCELCCSDFILAVSRIQQVKTMSVSVGCIASDSHFITPQLDYCHFMFAAFLDHSWCKSLICTKFNIQNGHLHTLTYHASIKDATLASCQMHNCFYSTCILFTSFFSSPLTCLNS